MSATTAAFTYQGTRVYHGHIGANVAACRFVQREAVTGDIVPCATLNRPIGVSPRDYEDGDDGSYHRSGKCSVETDGSAAVGDSVKAAADGSGKGIKDASPGTAPSAVAGGVLITLDATTNIGDVELYF